jgi:hypothetical protein
MFFKYITEQLAETLRAFAAAWVAGALAARALEVKGKGLCSQRRSDRRRWREAVSSCPTLRLCAGFYHSVQTAFISPFHGIWLVL